jgi:hypothetical protein
MKEPDLININRELTYALLRLRNKPTLSTAAGNTIARTLDVTPRTGKRLFHGGVAAAVGITVTRGLPSNAQVIAALGIGVLAFAFLEGFDPSR